jgi:predicted transcriptional regulator
MKKRKLLIGIRSLDQIKDETIAVFKRAEAGLPPEQPVHRLYFTDQETLFRNLSPKRMALLKYLRQHGPMSVRKLSVDLERDYKNVHTDVKLLMSISLVKTNRQGLVTVPWDDICIELSLAA